MCIRDSLDSQNLTPDQVKARLMLTATKNFPQSSVITDPTTDQTFTVQYDIFTVGAGYLDLDAAMASTATIPANENAASPIATIAAKLGIPGDALSPYGAFKAKIAAPFLKSLAGRPEGRLILVTAMRDVYKRQGGTE